MSAAQPQARRLLVGPGTWIGVVLIGLFFLVALLGPLLVHQSPTAQDLDHLLEGPSRQHWLGTDDSGCDLLSQMCYGARLAALISCTVVGLSLGLGVFLGALAGYLGGAVDEVLMRVIDVLMAFPGILLNIAIVAVIKNAGVGVMICALLANGWVAYARVARGQVLQVREREFVLAARALGAGPLWILRRHILPNILSPLIVQASFGFAGVVLVEASLSFLGLGPPVPYTWGALLSRGNQTLLRGQHLIMVPGVAIGLVVLGCNLLGDGLRDYLDPRTRR